MDLTEVRQLLEAFQNSGLHKMNLETPGLKLELQRCPEGTVRSFADDLPILEPAPIAAPAPVQVVQSVQTAAPAPAVQEALASKEPGGVPVKAGLVGTFYNAPAPGAEPFVKEGQQVKKGQTLCVLEAMKMMNEIAAPFSGTVERILVQPEQMVEYGQVLMTIVEN